MNENQLVLAHPNIRVHTPRNDIIKPIKKNSLMETEIWNAIYLFIIFMILLFVLFVVIEYEALFQLLFTCLVNVVLPYQDCRSSVYYKHPIIMWWTPMRFLQETATCDGVTCHVIGFTRSIKCLKLEVKGYVFDGLTFNLADLPLPRKKNNIWLYYNYDSPQFNADLYNEDLLKLFNYSSTFSRHSDVPFPVSCANSSESIISHKYYVNTEDKNKLLLGGFAPVLFIISDCHTASEREDYVEELMKYIPIDSYGGCLNNKKLPSAFKNHEEHHEFYITSPQIMELSAKYKFTIAIENAVCNDYVTEKFWRPIHVGSVPIYFGSPRIRDWMPNNKSAILLTDYPTPVIMANYIKSLLANDTLYEQHLEHKTKGLISNKLLLDEIERRPYQLDNTKLFNKINCFVCKKIHEFEKDKSMTRIIDKSHLDCPIPVSALDLKVNPENFYVEKALIAKEYKYIINKH